MNSIVNPIYQQSDFCSCQLRLLKGTDLVECVTRMKDCQWVKPIGYTSMMCKHPSALQYLYSRIRN